MPPTEVASPRVRQSIGKKERKMLNQVVMMGRLLEDPTTKKLEDENEVAKITVAVQRTFKNDEGIYETDLIPCTLLGSIAISTAEYCKKGDLIGVKGRLRVLEDKVEVVAEKVTFLSSKKVND